MKHHIKSNYSQTTVMNITPEVAGWAYLSFRVIKLQPGETYQENTGSNEVALVPLEGAGRLMVDNQQWSVSRESVFTQMPHVLYV
ncbi:MAG: 5-deoxy-glucuronate isomerase, partial [Anaerolineae bacterium]|nr:5-deoxy-glucuronate isomerase [Anaerolineae bacterium]